MLPRSCSLLVLRYIPPHDLWRLYNIPPRRLIVHPNVREVIGKVRRPHQYLGIAEVTLKNPQNTYTNLYSLCRTFDSEAMVKDLVFHHLGNGKGAEWVHRPMCRSPTWPRFRRYSPWHRPSLP